ncbi:MAG TPA: hypothetical protein VK684_12475 [Edaphobacter sp.]|jgi:hypothetical protein|nr:hypothetical protein [Edaphobacter sp.]
MPPPNTPFHTAAWSASLLRRDLSARAHQFARTQKLLHDISPGSDPVVIFGRDEQGRHGNFHPASDARICANPPWLRRLTKAHTASRRSRARNDWQWMELDSANSSDALLMNIFCHPGVFDGLAISRAVANLLNIDHATQPCFGINPGVPLKHHRKGRSKLPSELTDRTEIDLQLGNLFLEAKLTESNFQTAPFQLIERYRDLEIIFDLTRLKRNDSGTIQGYQLIRNVLAAFAADASFCVLCDTRRRDLIEIWYSVLSAVHYPSFAWRLKLLTWQELASVLPKDLQEFLDAKYGIVSA